MHAFVRHCFSVQMGKVFQMENSFCSYPMSGALVKLGYVVKNMHCLYRASFMHVPTCCSLSTPRVKGLPLHVTTLYESHSLVDIKTWDSDRFSDNLKDSSEGLESQEKMKSEIELLENMKKKEKTMADMKKTSTITSSRKHVLEKEVGPFFLVFSSFPSLVCVFQPMFHVDASLYVIGL